MPFYTWLLDAEFQNYAKVQDPELDHLFQQVREIFPRQYYIQEKEISVSRGLFRKRRKLFVYQLFARINEGPEVFYYEFPDWFRKLVPAEIVKSFFIGLLQGNHDAVERIHQFHPAPFPGELSETVSERMAAKLGPWPEDPRRQ